MSLGVPAELVDRSVSRFEREARRRSEEASLRPPRVITISRQLGSGGRRIAEALSSSLGWPLWDREILDVVASQSHLHYQARMFEALDERSQGDVDAVIEGLLGRVSKGVYLHLLTRAILTVGKSDGIILGRGGHLLLPQALKLQVVASVETRVANLMRYEGISREEAENRIQRSDRERKAFLQELAGRLRHRRPDPEKHPEFDLVLSTDSFAIEDAISIVMTAVTRRFGLKEIRRGAPAVEAA